MVNLIQTALSKIQGVVNKIDRDKSMPGFQAAQGGLGNRIGQAFQAYQARPSNQIANTIGQAVRPALEATGTFGNLAYQSIFNQPKLNRQMAVDTQKALDASNRALQAAKAAREAGRPDLAAQYTRSMIPQLQAESARFTQAGKEVEAKKKALISSGVRSALYTSAAARLPTSIGAGVVGAGLNAAFGGQTSPQQIARSFGESFKYGGFPNIPIAGGLAARSILGGAQNVAEDVAYAKLVEGRNLTPREAIISAATPGAFEAISKFVGKVGKSIPKQVVETVDPSGLMYNKAGQLFDPINGRWAKNTKEARLAAQNTKDFIASGGVPVKAGTRLVEMEDGKWVDESLIDQYKSEIETPKLSVEPVAQGGDLLSEARKYKTFDGFIRSNKVQELIDQSVPQELMSQGAYPARKALLDKYGVSSFEDLYNQAHGVAQGGLYDTNQTVFHGTSTGVKGKPVPGHTGGGAFGNGIYFTDNAEYAGKYADYAVKKVGGEGKVTEAKLNIKKPYIIDKNMNLDEIKKLSGETYDYSSMHNPDSPGDTAMQYIMGNPQKFTDNLKKQGYDGVVATMNHGKGDFKEILVFDKSQIKSLSPSKGGLSDVTKAVETPQPGMPMETKLPASTKAEKQIVKRLQPELQTTQTVDKLPKKDLDSLNSIISEGHKQIGRTQEPTEKNLKQTMDDLYTQWVDRYNPIVKASATAKGKLKAQGAELRPEFDPEYLVRRLTGAGGIADYRYRTELDPVLKEMESLKIDKSDMDVYLANKRMMGLAGRDIYGIDPEKSAQIVSAIETKYGPQITQIADKLYTYQNKGFQEMIDAGFLSKEAGDTIRSQNPDYAPLYRVMDQVDEYLGLPTRKTMQGSQPIAKLKGSMRQIESPVESIIGNTFRQRAAIEKNRVAQSIVGLQNIADMGFKQVQKSADDTITVWNNGKKEYWQVGKDIADVAKGQNEESMNTLLKIIQAPASLLRQGATGRNPEFMLPNIVRDQLDAAITSKYGYIPFVDFVSGFRSMLANDDIYQKWQNSGAKIDLGELSGKKSIQQLFDSKTKKKGLFNWLGEGLDVLGKFSEVPTRVGLFKKAYKKTGNELIAALESRDATVDFARMGSKMKVANSIIPFLNVGVQGFDKLIRSVKNNPGKVALNMAVYGAMPAIATTIYNLTNFPEEYAEIPQYEKDSNFVIVDGRNPNGTVNYKTYAKGNVLPVVTNPVTSFLEYVNGVDNQSFGEMATQLISSTLPVVGDGSSMGEVALKTIGSNLPQAIKPSAEVLLNKSFYKYDSKKEQAKEIVPQYLQKREPYQQFYEWTPKMYQKIGALLNVSPLKVQNLMEGYLAGYTKLPARFLDNMDKVSRGEELKASDKPILRRFIKTTTPSSSKPAEKMPTTPLMERLTGKAGAAEKVSTISDAQLESAKYKLKNSTQNNSKVGDILLYKKDNGDIGRVEITWTEPDLPKLTGTSEWDKKLISNYKSEITRRQTDIMTLFEQGQMTQEQAIEEYLKLDELKKTATNKTKKPKKITIKKVSGKLPTYKMKKMKIGRVKSLRSKPLKKVKFRSKL